MKCCTDDIWAKEGVRGFYRGVLSPVMGRSPIAAILFAGLGFSGRKLEEERPDWSENSRNFLSGMFAGFCYTNVAFGFDLLKVRLQNVRTGHLTYSETIRDIYQKEGIKGFTRGY